MWASGKDKGLRCIYLFPGSSGVPYTNYCMCNLCAACAASFLTFLCEQEQNRKKKHSSGSKETLRDQCTGACIYLDISCEFKNRGNRNYKSFREYEAGSERGYPFQSRPGRTDTAGDCRAISGGISGIFRQEYGGKASGRS